MITLTVCPSTLAEGFDTYSPTARKKMFDDKAVSHYLRVPSPSTNSEEANEAIRNAKRDRKSTRLNSSHRLESRMPSSA